MRSDIKTVCFAGMILIVCMLSTTIPVDPPEYEFKLKEKKTTISSPAITNIFWRDLHLNSGIVDITDREYDVVSKEEMQELLDKVNVFRHKDPSVENYDCDDYSLSLLGVMKNQDKNYAFGIIAVSKHVFNFFIDDYYQIWFIEPQNNNIYERWDENPILKSGARIKWILI